MSILTGKQGASGAAAGVAQFVPFSKIDDEKRMVYGAMTSEAVDSYTEVLDYDASKKAIMKAGGYAEWRNLRAMHQPIAAGTVPEITCDDTLRKVMIGAEVVDDQEWRKVKAGVYKGFSVHGKSNGTVIQKIDGKDVTRHVDIDFDEVSLVDRPANPDCSFTLIKRDWSDPDVQNAGRAADDAANVMSALNVVTQMVTGQLRIDDDASAQQLMTAQQNLLAFLQAKIAQQAQAVAMAEADEEETPEEQAAEAEGDGSDEKNGKNGSAQGAGVMDEAAVARVAGLVLKSPELRTLIKSYVDPLQATVDRSTAFSKRDDGERFLAKVQPQIDGVAAELKKLGALESRLARIEATPPYAGPVLREMPAGAAPKDGALEALNELIKSEQNPIQRDYLMQKRAQLELKAVYAGGGTRI